MTTPATALWKVSGRKVLFKTNKYFYEISSKFLDSGGKEGAGPSEEEKAEKEGEEEPEDETKEHEEL